MRDWRGLTQAERIEAEAKFSSSSQRNEWMEANFAATMELLKANPEAQAAARKVSWGSYLINTPEDIATYCRLAAK